MVEESQRKTPEHDSDYDGAWKEALRRHFRELVEKYFPAVAAEVDWNVLPVWSDKELSQVLGESGRRNRTVDVLVKLQLRSGTEQLILLHLEIQTSHEKDFERRIALYNSGLFWVFKQRVVTLVILADLREDWVPTEDTFCLADFESRLRFPACKLIHRLRSDWQDDHSLPVQVARAQIEALRTASDPEGRYRAKWQLVRKLYDLGYNVEEVREIFRLIDWMMHLRGDLDEQFEEQLMTFEESLEMPYVTSVERIWQARGEARGEARGIARGLLKPLAKICGPLSEEIDQRIHNLSIEKLDALAEAFLDFNSIDDLQAWLANNDSSDQ